MKSKKLLLLISIFVFSAKMSAQKWELGKVSVAELEEKSHPKDTAATAAVLYNKCKTSFGYDAKEGFFAKNDFEVRIKIYKTEGLKYATYEIPYFVGYENINPDFVKFSDAATYNLVNGKVEKTKLTGDGIFKEKVNEDVKTITITLPNVKIGSVIEFKYTLRSENISFFPVFKIQRDIPVNFAEYKTDIPVYYRYKTVVTGSIPVKSDNAVTTGYQSITQVSGQSATMSYQQISSTHTAKDVPALKQEDYVDNIDNYRSTVNYELEVIRMPDQPEKNISQTWEGVAQTIFKYDDFGKELKTRGYFEADVKPIYDSPDTKLEKATAVLNFLKAKMRWNGKFGIYTRDGVKKAWLNRTGNVAEINFILISMLNYIGIRTNPVLVSTVGNGVAIFPNRTAFNYIIAAADIDGKRVLLDATNKNSLPNILPLFTLNWNGRMIAEDGTSEEINLVPTVVSKDVKTLTAVLTPDGVVTGKVRLSKTDYEAFEFRENYSGMNRDNYLEKLENKWNGIQISNYAIENENNLSAPIQETFDFKSDRNVEVIGGKLYVNPLLFFLQNKNPFVQEDRKLPVYFGYPSLAKYVFTIDIPEGYQVENLPAPLSVSTGENVASFKYTIQVSGNKIQISVNFEVDQMLVAAEFYPILKEFFKKMTDKESEKIVLKKI